MCKESETFVDSRRAMHDVGGLLLERAKAAGAVRPGQTLTDVEATPEPTGRTPPVSAEVAHRAASLAPGGRFVDIDGAGHLARWIVPSR
jgi:hypothetical protein